MTIKEAEQIKTAYESKLSRDEKTSMGERMKYVRAVQALRNKALKIGD